MGSMTTTLVTGETWGENVDGVRAHLLAEAEQPFSVLRPNLEMARQEFEAAIEQVSNQQAQFRPESGQGEDAWGIAEVLRHIATIEPIMAQRVRLLGSGQYTDSLPRTQSGSTANVQTRDIAELRQAVDRSFADLLAAIDNIAGHERLDTLVAHRRFGELNCRGWVALHTAHLRDHARQIANIKGLAAYPAA
jgi:hypothetical protein